MPSPKTKQKAKSAVNDIDVFDYDEAHVEEKTAKDIKECFKYKDTDTVTWLNIDQVPPISFLQELRLGFDLHPVVVDDILNMNQRPKAEILDNYVFLAMKMFVLDPDKKKIVPEQISMVVSQKFLITFQQGIKGDTFEPVRRLLRQAGTRIRALGTDYLCYELIHSSVDNYFRILENFGDRIEKTEEELTGRHTTRVVQRIHRMKREILELRKSVWPLRELTNALEQAQMPLIRRGTKIYFRDISERLIQVIDTIETYRDTLSGLMDLHISTASNRTNAVIKVLTIITTLFMPLSFLAGFYGMNFEHLPGLASPFGPILLVLAMLAVAAGMLYFFRKKGWI